MLRTAEIPRRKILDAQRHRNSTPSDPGCSEPPEFLTKRSWALRPSEFHTELSRMLKTIGIPHRAILGAQNHRNSTPSCPGSSKPLEFRIERRSDLRPLRTIGIPPERSRIISIFEIPQRAILDAQIASEPS